MRWLRAYFFVDLKLSQNPYMPTTVSYFLCSVRASYVTTEYLNLIGVPVSLLVAAEGRPRLITKANQVRSPTNQIWCSITGSGVRPIKCRVRSLTLTNQIWCCIAGSEVRPIKSGVASSGQGGFLSYHSRLFLVSHHRIGKNKIHYCKI